MERISHEIRLIYLYIYDHNCYTLIHHDIIINSFIQLLGSYFGVEMKMPVNLV